MKKYSFLTYFLIFCFLIIHGINGQSWIRVNQLGYNPEDVKVAVLVSKEKLTLSSFSLCDALTGKQLFTSDNIKDFGSYGAFTSTFRLTFTEYRQSGGVYIEAHGVRSPVFAIGWEVYDGAADFLLRYMRQQRCGYNPFLRDSCHTRDGYAIYHPNADSSHIDVTGGWHDATDYLQYTTTSANAIYQMALAYRMNPQAFGDNHLANGDAGQNDRPDIVDEIYWGLQWLVKMNPDSGELYNQIADDRDHQGFRLPNHDKVDYGKGRERPVYFCTGKPQGLFEYKNSATGIASIAGKVSSAFAIGALVLSDYEPEFCNLLKKKAHENWAFGAANPGVCQTAPCTAPYFYEEDNWVDDMELAGATLFELTGNKEYLDAAALYGRQELVTPWMGADTARHYQWYPFVNMGHWAVAKANDNRYTNEFAGYWRSGIEKVWAKGKENPFLNGIPGIWCSNNLTVAMLTQCHLYEGLTGDSTFREMEAALRDWLFGCNPWGTSMVVGMPAFGDYPVDPHSSLSVLHGYRLDGGLVDGPVYHSIFRNLKGISIEKGDEYAPFQSGLTVYHDDYADYSTNEPTMDGTACFTYYLAALQGEVFQKIKGMQQADYSYGALIRGNPRQQNICLLFTGHDKADGYKLVRNTLEKHQVRASFFLTGDFYRNKRFKGIIKSMISGGHYLGAHSDRHLLYCDWTKRDSLLVSRNEFVSDLKENYRAMAQFDIPASDAPYFLPPFEWYNDSIAIWCKQYGLRLVNFTPGTTSNQDWTYPELGKQYMTSDTIYRRILNVEEHDSMKLNGFMLLTHFGTDRRRPDKFYERLDELITELKKREYKFVTVAEMLK
ncbi:MAG: glycoside hydrolase family 9 protein [Bacteroidales bacterium]|nr:glycoside hydrolase family 9 protein [Bacteroidales bacterium]